jgi:ABC transport system ATP-binding/permease protein
MSIDAAATSISVSTGTPEVLHDFPAGHSHDDGMSSFDRDLAKVQTAERPPTSGARIDVRSVSQHAGGRRLLHDVSLSVRPGELVAVMGPSGAGKTTLLDLMAGVRGPSGGDVRHDGVVVDATSAPARPVGYVPQDDIIHLDLPLRRTLLYAARLRLPAGSTARDADRAVDSVLRDLGLSDRADVVVRRLSGGQRKRASIAVELLAAPHTLFLDEPTSSLDPATSAGVVRLLRRLAGRGITVVLTTHDPASIDVCDQVVLLERDGQLAFAGTPAEARAAFGVADLTVVFDLLATGATTPREWADRYVASRAPTASASSSPAAGPTSAPSAEGAVPTPVPRAGLLRQTWLLARRNADVLGRSRLTLAILVGSPVLVTVMLAMLFRPHAFDAHAAADLGPAQVVFWTAFSGFFFGLTYGLLQIVGEQAIVRRERRSGLRPVAYVASKIVVLVPVLAGVTAVMLAVLRGLDRLPGESWRVYGSLFVTLMTEEVSALALGLLASAAVATSAQAALALPMLCFPQVLFAGAVVPIDDMAPTGRALSFGLSNRYAFEALGTDLRLDAATRTLPSLHGYDGVFDGAVAGRWLVLTALTVVFALATVHVLDRRALAGSKGRHAG